MRRVLRLAVLMLAACAAAPAGALAAAPAAPATAREARSAVLAQALPHAAAVGRALDRLREHGDARPAVPATLARPTDPGDRDALIVYRSPEATPYDTPNFRIHYVADPADPDAPDAVDANVDAAGAPAPNGVPDYVEVVGAELEAVREIEVARFGYAPPPADVVDGVALGGDARFDVYLADFDAHGERGLLGLATNDPHPSRLTYLMLDDDYLPSELRTSDPAVAEGVRKVTIAHEYFHAIQQGYAGGFMPVWLAEATAVWMESQVFPDLHDNDAYLRELLGAGTEVPLTLEGSLHQYGTWWFVRHATTAGPAGRTWVRRLLEGFAARRSRGDVSDLGLGILARTSGGADGLARLFRDYAVRNWTTYFKTLLRTHRTTTLRRGKPRWERVDRIQGMQVHYHRFAVPRRRILVNVQGAPGTLRPADIALIAGGPSGRVVTRVRRLDKSTLSVEATIPEGLPKVAVLVVTHTRVGPAAYQVGALAR